MSKINKKGIKNLNKRGQFHPSNNLDHRDFIIEDGFNNWLKKLLERFKK